MQAKPDMGKTTAHKLNIKHFEGFKKKKIQGWDEKSVSLYFEGSLRESTIIMHTNTGESKCYLRDVVTGPVTLLKQFLSLISKCDSPTAP